MSDNNQISDEARRAVNDKIINSSTSDLNRTLEAGSFSKLRRKDSLNKTGQDVRSPPNSQL